MKKSSFENETLKSMALRDILCLNNCLKSLKMEVTDVKYGG